MPDSKYPHDSNLNRLTHNTMFRQEFLLSQYVNNILSVQTHNIRNILLTADCFNNIVFILVTKSSSKKVCEKMEDNSTLEQVSLVCKSNAELLRLVEATFDSKVASFKRMRKKNLIILKRLQKKSL